MRFVFRKTSFEDIVLYRKCFIDEEFRYMLYCRNAINPDCLERYVAENGTDLKFVGALEMADGALCDIGFAHFYHKDNGAYTYVGGVLPAYFNSGIGVYASVAMISLLYEIKATDLVVTTGVYKYNMRSVRLLKAIGFVGVDETADKFILRLTNERFNNGLVARIKERLSYSRCI